jgi:putative NADH-flavin reductase
MNIAVIGSTSRTGRHLLAEGVRRGHRITAFTRKPPEALLDQPGLAEIVHGDGGDREAVRETVRASDAVIAIVAARSREGPHQAAAVAHTAVGVMSEEGVARLVMTSAYPLVGQKPRVPMSILRRIFAAAYADCAVMEQTIADSDLDWTIARWTRLTNGHSRGGAAISRDLLAKTRSLPRVDAARVPLEIVEDPTLSRAAVNVAGGREARRARDSERKLDAVHDEVLTSRAINARQVETRPIVRR